MPFGDLETLRENITRIQFPASVHNQPTMAQQTAVYLRRLQNEMLRVMPQINRSVQLIEEGNHQQLTQLIPVFESFNRANNVAIESIQRLNQPNQPSPPPQPPRTTEENRPQEQKKE